MRNNYGSKSFLGPIRFQIFSRLHCTVPLIKWLLLIYCHYKCNEILLCLLCHSLYRNCWTPLSCNWVDTPKKEDSPLGVSIQWPDNLPCQVRNRQRRRVCVFEHSDQLAVAVEVRFHPFRSRLASIAAATSSVRLCFSWSRLRDICSDEGVPRRSRNRTQVSARLRMSARASIFGWWGSWVGRPVRCISARSVYGAHRGTTSFSNNSCRLANVIFRFQAKQIKEEHYTNHSYSL